jgi:hypothetical protein
MRRRGCVVWRPVQRRPAGDVLAFTRARAQFRRMTFPRRSLALLALAALAPPARAQTHPRLQVWRDENCGCCHHWVEHMRQAGFAVEDNIVPSVGAVRRMLGTPSDLLSCHAALVGGYVLEGHVPAGAVRRLLAERPSGVRGLAVPGMPVGSPGMEVPGEAPDSYEVVAFDAAGGRRVFMRFRGGEPA